MVEQFSCRRSHADTACHVELTGELDIATVPQLDRVLRSAAADAALVILDLRDLAFMDASGARSIVAAERLVRQAGGRMVVVRGPAQVERLFALTGIERELELVDQPPASGRMQGVAA